MPNQSGRLLPLIWQGERLNEVCNGSLVVRQFKSPNELHQKLAMYYEYIFTVQFYWRNHEVVLQVKRKFIIQANTITSVTSEETNWRLDKVKWHKILAWKIE